MKPITPLVLSMVVALSSAQAYARGDQFLINMPAGAPLHLTEVCFERPGEVIKWEVFADEGGHMALDDRTVQGVNLQGDPVAIPFHEVIWIKVRRERDHQAGHDFLRLESFLRSPTWPPRGRLIRLALHNGLTCEFEGMGPELRLQSKEIVWSCRGEREVRLPLQQVYWVEYRKNSLTTDNDELARFGSLAEATLRSGESVNLLGRTGWLDAERGLIGCEDPVWESALAEVQSVRVTDCRREAVREVTLKEKVAPEFITDACLPLIGLETGKRVRLKTAEPEADWLTGTFSAYRGGNITLQTDNHQTVIIAEDELQEFQISRGVRNHAGTGAAIGAGLGAAAGLGTGLAFAADGFFDVGAGQVMGFTLLAATAGAAVGALFGSMVRTEHFEERAGIDKAGPAVEPEDEWIIGVTLNF